MLKLKNMIQKWFQYIYKGFLIHQFFQNHQIFLFRFFPLLLNTHQMAVTPQVSSNALILIKKMVFFANSQQIENVVQAKPIIVENIADVIAATLDREVSLFS